VFGSFTLLQAQAWCGIDVGYCMPPGFKVLEFDEGRIATDVVVTASVEESIDYPLSLLKFDISILTNPIMYWNRVRRRSRRLSTTQRGCSR
jgi:hypothetical protein